MTPDRLKRELSETESMALTAYPFVPDRSKYKAWIRDLLAGTIPAWKYAKLRPRLERFHMQG